jgi:Cu2+-exporting ATPase
MTTPFWQRFARWYVGMVLVAAAAGLLFTRDLDVATAVLIVTCPCAFGIALPLANEMVQAGLRRAGLFVRSIGFLERAAAVKTVIFDKTGTLTSGALKLAGPLPALDEDAKAALGAMVARSNHPKSVAIRRALDGHYESAPVVELPGRGLELTRDGKTYRLGAPSWVGGQGDVSFSVDGRLLADFETVEEHRPDAAREVEALRSRGYDVWLVSGDKKERVEEAARACGIERAMGEQSAEEKAALVKGRPDLLMVGDGINDSLAVESAFCSGTPAIDRPFMAARSDFYFVTPGLHPVTLALRAARGLVGLRRKILGIALAYNALAIALAYAGVMSPLVCAVFMPVSSLTTIFATTFALRRSAGLWRS